MLINRKNNITLFLNKDCHYHRNFSVLLYVTHNYRNAISGLNLYGTNEAMRVQKMK